LLNLLAMLVDASKKKNCLPFTISVRFHPLIPRNHIGQHFLVSVSDVGRRVRVIDGRGDEKRLWHFCDKLPDESFQGKRLACRVSRAFLCFHWRSRYARATVGYEESFQNPVFDPGSRDLHSEFRGRQAELSEDR
jgi:hypothetical protein